MDPTRRQMEDWNTKEDMAIHNERRFDDDEGIME